MVPQVITDTLCLRAAFAAKADDHWSKSLHLADEQYYAIAPYLGENKNGGFNGWTWMDMENGGIWIQVIIGLCKQPLGYVGLRPWLPFVVQQPGRQLCSSWKATD